MSRLSIADKHKAEQICKFARKSKTRKIQMNLAYINKLLVEGTFFDYMTRFTHLMFTDTFTNVWRCSKLQMSCESWVWTVSLANHGGKNVGKYSFEASPVFSLAGTGVTGASFTVDGFSCTRRVDSCRLAVVLPIDVLLPKAFPEVIHPIADVSKWNRTHAVIALGAHIAFVVM